MSTFARPVTTSTPPRRTWVGLFWTINLTFLLLTCGWILADARSLKFVEAWPTTRGAFGYLVLGVVGGSLAGIFAGLFSGPTRHRSVKAWLVFMALASVWCAMFASWRTLYYYGQSLRVNRDVPTYQAFVQQWRKRWPNHDGRSSELGFFLAYPLDKPRTLLFPGPARVEDAAPIAAVERSENGAIRLQLAGEETGAWLEWHPDGSVPKTFVGGLMTRYELVRSTEVRPGWYLTRYRED